MQLKSSTRIIVKSKAVQSFANAARVYCSFIEECDKFNRMEFLKKAHEFLALVYYRALLLPDVELKGELPKERMTLEQWKELVESFRQKLGDWNYYWDIFNPSEATQETKAICSSLAGDLVDTYQDLQHGLVQWKIKSVRAKQNAVWQWKLNFQFHTGQHINGALRYLYWRLYDLLDDEEFLENEIP
jgi:hypothetical protein